MQAPPFVQVAQAQAIPLRQDPLNRFMSMASSPRQRNIRKWQRQQINTAQRVGHIYQTRVRPQEVQFNLNLSPFRSLAQLEPGVFFIIPIVSCSIIPQNTLPRPKQTPTPNKYHALPKQVVHDPKIDTMISLSFFGTERLPPWPEPD